MSQQVLFKLELPGDLERFQLPRGVDERLHGLLDRQDRGEELTLDERREAESLVDLAELLSLLKLRAQRAWQTKTLAQHVSARLRRLVVRRARNRCEYCGLSNR